MKKLVTQRMYIENEFNIKKQRLEEARALTKAKIKLEKTHQQQS
jgi:hypothetical protein